jgi:hypothetical protein
MEAVMVTANARKMPPGSPSDVNKSTIADIVNVLARHNPGISKLALKATGKAVAAMTAATGRLSPEQQRQIAVHEKDLTEAMEAAVAHLSARRPEKLIPLGVNKTIEFSQGSGLGQLLEIDEGRRRIADYSTPVRLEDWAGPVAGPGEIEKAYGTKRSTLHDWQKRGAIIGLLKGERKHVFPLAQFVDGRPVEGMAQVTKLIGNPRTAWYWLIQLKPSIGATPLDRLKAGHLPEVLDAAERDFG